MLGTHHRTPNTTTEEGESLSQLFEYTVPEWLGHNDDHLTEDEPSLGNAI